MSNSSLTTADGTTHLKIVVVALIASVTVMVVGLTARTPVDPGAPQILRAGQALVAAGNPATTVR